MKQSTNQSINQSISQSINQIKSMFKQIIKQANLNRGVQIEPNRVEPIKLHCQVHLHWFESLQYHTWLQGGLRRKIT